LISGSPRPHRERKRHEYVDANLPFSPGFVRPRLSARLGGNLEHQPTATFSETKYIALLDDPVQSSGELRFVAPDHLEKRTLKPKRELLVLDGGTLTVEQRKRKHVLQLSEYPEVASMIESIRATLAGDRKALERAYHLALSGNADAWTLQLIPLEAKVGAVVASIKIGEEHRDPSSGW